MSITIEKNGRVAWVYRVSPTGNIVKSRPNTPLKTAAGWREATAEEIAAAEAREAKRAEAELEAAKADAIRLGREAAQRDRDEVAQGLRSRRA
jgi:hypothetical protein